MAMLDFMQGCLNRRGITSWKRQISKRSAVLELLGDMQVFHRGSQLEIRVLGVGVVYTPESFKDATTFILGWKSGHDYRARKEMA